MHCSFAMVTSVFVLSSSSLLFLFFFFFSFKYFGICFLFLLFFYFNNRMFCLHYSKLSNDSSIVLAVNIIQDTYDR
jgi:hypothetical protein